MPFDIHTPVNRGKRKAYYDCPTVVVCVAVALPGGDQLFMVLPKDADPHGWIFLQGKVDIAETLREAMYRQLQEQCQWGEGLFAADSARPLCRRVIKARIENNPPKEYFVVGIRMTTWVPPTLDSQNSKFVLLPGPNCAWSHVSDGATDQGGEIPRLFQYQNYQYTIAYMQFIPIKTRILTPPQDNVLEVLKESLVDVRENDVICISSKVVAIHEGRCVASEDVNKTALVESEADFIIPTDYRPYPLTVTRHTFLGAAGVDESNGNGYLVLLPTDCFASAKYLHEFFTATYGVQNIGVIITDSRSLPFRYGAMGVALGWWGIEPLEDHIGKPDLFGREFKYERSNIVDGLAAGAAVVGGETNECTPLVVVRNVPNLSFTEQDTRDQLLAPYADDTFRVLYERWL